MNRNISFEQFILCLFIIFLSKKIIPKLEGHRHYTIQPLSIYYQIRHMVKLHLDLGMHLWAKLRRDLVVQMYIIFFFKTLEYLCMIHMYRTIYIKANRNMSKIVNLRYYTILFVCWIRYHSYTMRLWRSIARMYSNFILDNFITVNSRSNVRGIVQLLL